MTETLLRRGVAVAFAAVAAVLLSVPAIADASGTGGARTISAGREMAAALVSDAAEVFEGTVTNRRFQEEVATARAILIFPSLLRAAYVVGGESGEGVLLVRDDYGDWSFPAFYRIVGGSFGLQIGVSVSELVLVVRTDSALQSILDGSVDLGGDLSIAIGPESVDAGIDIAADIVSFTTSKGLYAGLSVEGSTLSELDGRNESYYGRAVSARDIVLGEEVDNPQANGLRDRLVLYVRAIERDQRTEGND